MSGFLIISGAQETWTFQRFCKITLQNRQLLFTQPGTGGDLNLLALQNLLVVTQECTTLAARRAAGSLSHLGDKVNHAVCQLESHVFRAVFDFCLTRFWESGWCIWLVSEHVNKVSQFHNILEASTRYFPQTAGEE